MCNEVDVVVMGGLTINVEFKTSPPDRSVGEYSDNVDGWWIVGIAGRTLGKREKTDWIEKRLSKKDKQRIEDACYAHIDRYN